MSQISARREAASQAARDHWIAERVFDWSGVATTHIRPTFFADWLIIPQLAKEIWATKKIDFPFADGRHAPISSDDQGRVIAHLLANPEGREGRTYTLHGPVEMSHTEIAAAVTEVLGEKVSYAPMTIPEWREKMETVYQFSPFRVQHLAAVAQDYQDGIFAGTNDAVEQITGTPPMSVPEFLSRYRAAFV
jgi:uncharacterized protein YbjT (DUF2867 family)